MDDNKIAVLLEDLMTQFRTFEGLRLLNDKVDQNIRENRQEHQQIIEKTDRIFIENLWSNRPFPGHRAQNLN